MKQHYYNIILAIILYMVGVKTFAYDIAVENADGITIYYNYISDGKELEVTSKGKNEVYVGDINIPEEVLFMNRSRKVTGIGNRAFYNNYRTFTSISIPNSVTYIGEEAFACCYGLTTITIPQSVTTIENSAFYECRNLTSVTIPNNVKSIGKCAFAYCYNLTSLILPSSVTSIGDGAFGECSRLTSINIPNGVTTINNGVFRGCAFTSITIPNSVTTIGDEAFYECGLTSITIPNNVISIGEKAFLRCWRLTSVIISNSVKTIGSEAFYSCKNLTSVTMGNNITSIGYGAFADCIGLSSITIPNSVTTIGQSAFYGPDFYVIVSLIENPFSIIGKSDYFSPFNKNTFNNATLFVPVGTIDKYKATEGWKDFLYIKEGNPSSINKIVDNNLKETKRFTIDGKSIIHQKGINIIQFNNGTTKKVIINR